MAIDSLFKRADDAVRQGQLWRAKEVLQGGIRARGYDHALFERLGVVLLQMGDAVEAGKYLFLSGRRKLSYAEPIALYLGRYTRKRPLHLYATFPRVARLPYRENYPPAVAAKLAELGFPDELKASTAVALAAGSGTRLIGLGCLAVMVMFLVLAVLGVVWLVERFARI